MSAAESAQVLYPLSSDATALHAAINGRAPPSADMPMTCISCGIDTAAALLQFSGSAEAMPLLLVLTDGEQTVLGGDEEAVYAATAAKSGGASLVALSLGDSLQETMDRMASEPTAIYSRWAETVEVLLEQVLLLFTPPPSHLTPFNPPPPLHTATCCSGRSRRS